LLQVVGFDVAVVYVTLPVYITHVYVVARLLRCLPLLRCYVWLLPHTDILVGCYVYVYGWLHLVVVPVGLVGWLVYTVALTFGCTVVVTVFVGLLVTVDWFAPHVDVYVLPFLYIRLLLHRLLHAVVGWLRFTHVGCVLLFVYVAVVVVTFTLVGYGCWLQFVAFTGYGCPFTVTFTHVTHVCWVVVCTRLFRTVVRCCCCRWLHTCYGLLLRLRWFTYTFGYVTVRWFTVYLRWLHHVVRLLRCSLVGCRLFTGSVRSLHHGLRLPRTTVAVTHVGCLPHTALVTLRLHAVYPVRLVAHTFTLLHSVYVRSRYCGCLPRYGLRLRAFTVVGYTVRSGCCGLRFAVVGYGYVGYVTPVVAHFGWLPRSFPALPHVFTVTFVTVGLVTLRLVHVWLVVTLRCLVTRLPLLRLFTFTFVVVHGYGWLRLRCCTRTFTVAFYGYTHTHAVALLHGSLPVYLHCCTVTILGYVTVPFGTRCTRLFGYFYHTRARFAFGWLVLLFTVTFGAVAWFTRLRFVRSPTVAVTFTLPLCLVLRSRVVPVYVVTPPRYSYAHHVGTYARTVTFLRWFTFTLLPCRLVTLLVTVTVTHALRLYTLPVWFRLHTLLFRLLGSFCCGYYTHTVVCVVTALVAVYTHGLLLHTYVTHTHHTRCGSHHTVGCPTVPVTARLRYGLYLVTVAVTVYVYVAVHGTRLVTVYVYTFTFTVAARLLPLLLVTVAHAFTVTHTRYVGLPVTRAVVPTLHARLPVWLVPVVYVVHTFPRYVPRVTLRFTHVARSPVTTYTPRLPVYTPVGWLWFTTRLHTRTHVYVRFTRLFTHGYGLLRCVYTHTLYAVVPHICAVVYVTVGYGCGCCTFTFRLPCVCSTVSYV